ncbi:hypothetical protein COV82_01720 [Candidatus Peregrinibacteria bacterium CG11_big_fil_rev_8_21_14_0_20_46_8]|nr:MAG: hypothetical protein COV82_01720 [Candidatus Peregrinibacteria bacterium CG11_big_fil_rev_8_21_14_0_20_46_8]
MNQSQEIKHFPQEFDQAVDLIQKSHRILLVSHRRPDGDTLGASIALAMALDQMGKNPILACIDDIPKRLRFLPWSDRFITSFNMDEYDLIIISDAGASHMTGFHERYPEFLSKKVPILNIDHHASNELFGTVNIVDPKTSSASMITWKLIQRLPVKVNRDMALAIMTGIYNDTGGMMHANTTQDTFAIAAELMEQGIKIEEIVKPLFRDATLSQLRLWGFILENLRLNDQGVVSSVVTQDDIEEIDAYSGDTGGIVDLMNTVEGARFTMLLTEDNDYVKGSLRTQRDDVNVSDIAGQFGGGGHPKASGFRVHGQLEKKIVWKIVPKNA